MLLENVKGLVSHDKGKTLDTIIQTLCDIGYTVDFNILNSKYFGVPQNRERIFIVAIRDDLIEPSEWVIEGNTIVPKGKRRIQQLDGVKTFNFDWPEQTEVTTRLRDILEDNVDERFYLSEEKTAKLVTQLRDREKDILNERKDGDINPIYSPDLITKNQNGRRIKPADDVMPALTVQDRHGVVEQFSQGDGVSCCVDVRYGKGTAPGDVGKGRRTHVVEGLPIREATKKGYAIANEGDAVNIQFPDSKTRRGRVGKQIAQTLEASGVNQGVVTEPPKYRIRKLTPRECFRLQGFPDSEFDKLVAAGISNSQLYKMAGNAVTVNVIDAIGRRLLPLITD
jgi:DNA (cytosine-5)-methyltransferase 1